MSPCPFGLYSGGDALMCSVRCDGVMMMEVTWNNEELWPCVILILMCGVMNEEEKNNNDVWWRPNNKNGGNENGGRK